MGALGPQGINLSQGLSQDILVEEKDCRKRLVLGACCQMPAHGQISEERLGFLLRRPITNKVPAKVIVTGNPSAIGVLSAVGQVLHAYLCPNKGMTSARDFIYGERWAFFGSIAS